MERNKQAVLEDIHNHVPSLSVIGYVCALFMLLSFLVYVAAAGMEGVAPKNFLFEVYLSG